MPLEKLRTQMVQCAKNHLKVELNVIYNPGAQCGKMPVLGFPAYDFLFPYFLFLFLVTTFKKQALA